MADIRPFRGIRYNDEKFADLSPVLAPPYDVVSPADYTKLRDRSRYNSVQLILRPKAEPSDNEADYAQNSETLNDWLCDEILVQDIAPAIYLLDQQFTCNGETRTRSALIARLRLEKFCDGQIFPHEETMPGPKADRLALMNATQMNMSQILGLYQDDGSILPLLQQMAEIEPIAEGTGIDGVKNTLRAVYHGKLIAALAKAFEDKKIIVADGHHRYETALAYRDLMRPRRSKQTFDEPFEFISVALVSTEDPGLCIRPTHRLVTLKGFNADEFLMKAELAYEIEDIAAEPLAITARLDALSERHAFGFIFKQGARILVRRMGRREANGQPESLDTHILHNEILNGVLGLGPDNWHEGGPISYVHNVQDCLDAVAKGKANFALALNPARVDEVQAISFARGKMPPKSTFFFPKIPTGIVINPLI